MDRKSPLLAVGFAAFAVIFGVNGLFMLAAPELWYARVPGVTDTGPINDHFIRDIGCAYVVQSAAAAWALRASVWRLPAAALLAAMNVLHSALHLWDLAAERLGPTHWLLDGGQIFVPTAVLVALFFAALRQEKERRHAGLDTRPLR